MNFTREEYDARIAKTRKAMAEQGLDVIVAADPSNISWLTGYDGWSFYTPQAVVLGMKGEPIWWGRGIDQPGAVQTCWMSKDNLLGFPDEYVQSAERHAFELLAALLKERGFGQARIGVEMDNYYYSARSHDVLLTHLPDAEISDCTSLVNWQRAVKSETEISYMRKAGKITDKIIEMIREKAEPGVKKNIMAADIYHTAISGVDDAWGDYPAIVPLLPSGMDATAAHLTWDDRPFKSGEMTFFEIAGAHKRYQCPQSRTIYLGEPPQKYKDAEKAVVEALEAGLALVKPGATCEEVAIAFYDTLGKHGFEKDSRTGYAIGISYPPDWGERTMSFRRGDKSVLEAGMTFHFMPALWLDDGGLEISEPFLVTETGHECFCSSPRELFVKR